MEHGRKWENEKGSKFFKLKGKIGLLRKPMHKETVSGIIRLKLKKSVSLPTAIDNWEMTSRKIA